MDKKKNNKKKKENVGEQQLHKLTKLISSRQKQLAKEEPKKKNKLENMKKEHN